MGEPASDPRDLIRNAPMSMRQVQAVALTSALSALDGFDLLSITFVAPVLAKYFHAGSGTLGILLSSGLFGTLIGSLVLAPLADNLGRRPVALLSIVIMAAGMLLSAGCQSVQALAIVRIFTGIGIGAMVVVVNPIAVEVSNARRRSLALSMMTIGYPIGGIIGGLTAGYLLRYYDWQAVFLVGACFALVMALPVFWRLPESLPFLLDHRNASSLERVNELLAQFNHAPLAVLPPAAVQPITPYKEIFSRGQVGVTVQVSIISFLTFLTIYFFLSWLPKILVDAGIPPASAAAISGASSLAGACGCAVFGLLSIRTRSKILAIISILGLGIGVIAFGVCPSSPATLIACAILTGSFLTAATVGLYVVAAAAFPAQLRATGTGFMIGIGRIGSVVSPSLAGALFAFGARRSFVAGAMGASAIIAALLIVNLKRHYDHR